MGWKGNRDAKEDGSAARSVDSRRVRGSRGALAREGWEIQRDDLEMCFATTSLGGGRTRKERTHDSCRGTSSGKGVATTPTRGSRGKWWFERELREIERQSAAWELTQAVEIGSVGGSAATTDELQQQYHPKSQQQWWQAWKEQEVCTYVHIYVCTYAREAVCVVCM